MLSPIVSFSQDDCGDWIAHLACGHKRHVRHRPPFIERPWVASRPQRAAMIGVLLECGACEEGGDVSGPAQG
jgi:hypothetical protein